MPSQTDLDITIDWMASYFSSHFAYHSDLSDGGCDTCGYGGESGMSLEAIEDALKEFKTSKERRELESLLKETKCQEK